MIITEEEEEFLAQYEKVKMVIAGKEKNRKPILCSPYTLSEQIERFGNFSLTEEECRALHEDISSDWIPNPVYANQKRRDSSWCKNVDKQ